MPLNLTMLESTTGITTATTHMATVSSVLPVGAIIGIVIGVIALAVVVVGVVCTVVHRRQNDAAVANESTVGVVNEHE